MHVDGLNSDSGASGRGTGSEPVLQKRPPTILPFSLLLNEQYRKGGLIYSGLTRGALIYAFAMLGSGGVGPDY